MTLLLTCVAMKNVLSSALPKLGYSTYMDKFVSCCFFFLMIHMGASSVANPRFLCAKEALTWGDFNTCFTDYRNSGSTAFKNLNGFDMWFQLIFFTAFTLIFAAVPLSQN